MLFLRFPFVWGPAEVVVPPPFVPPPFWGAVGANVLLWNRDQAGPLPRFQHIYAQTAGVDQQFQRLHPSLRTIA